jgi:hypothetical protein
MSGPGTKGRAGLALALLVAAAAFALFSMDNRFPGYYHVNEPDKGIQILKDERNFLHPLLMLTATDAVGLVLGRPQSMQEAIQHGRVVSALAAAAGVAALSLIGWGAGGWLGAVAVALFAGSSYVLYESAHYMKEDAAFTLGIGLFLLALVGFARRPSSGRAIALGVACGIAISAKYVGGVFVPLAVTVILLARPPRDLAAGGSPDARFPSRRRLLWAALLLAALGLAVAVVNYRVITEFDRFERGFSAEWKHGVAGTLPDVDVAPSPVPHLRYRRNVEQVTPLILVLALAGVVQAIRRRGPRPELALVAAFSGWNLLVLSFSPLHSETYFLPVELGLRTLAGLMVPGIRDLRLFAAHPKLRALGVGAALLLPCAVALPPLAERIAAFRHDYRADLMRWMRENLPPDAVIAQDGKARIPTPDDWRFAGATMHGPQRVLFSRHLSAEWGSVEALRAKGVTHVVVAADDIRRYGRARGGSASQRRFYEELVQHSTLLWKSPVRESWDTVLNPELYLYALPAVAPREAGTGRARP